ncbi:MAG TPA: hypothetical protein VGM27_16505 [Acidobacteriaceae bacterium]|jgi:hypothetical protein
MDPIVNKLTTSLPDSTSSETGGQPGKAGASKFDKIRGQLKDNAGNEASPTQSASPANPPVANSEPNVDRVQRVGAAAPDRVHQSLAASHFHLARLRERVESTPGTSSMQGLQGRLTSVEHLYARLDSAVKAMPPNASPQQWLALQQQVYSMNESISALSKMVGQAASGVKSVLQTQV